MPLRSHIIAIRNLASALPILFHLKNIRIKLGARSHAQHSRSVSSRFSAGDSIREAWTDGTTVEQVDAIVQRYRAGYFDAITDCYEYRDDRGFGL